MIPERRAEATDLARGALDLARAEVPAYAPDQAARLVRCLLLLDRFDDALDALSLAEQEAASLEQLRALSTLRKLRVIAHVRRGDGAPAVDAAMAALREALEATGSPRIASECLLALARNLPPECTHPDVLALLEEPAERFAEMPMPAQEELCRETRGDVLLARGQREEAAACFARAAKRLQHYGLLLRVPWLEVKRDAALGKVPPETPPPEAAEPDGGGRATGSA
jgi:tetratricopeptide (TPR) repeat protein